LKDNLDCELSKRDFYVFIREGFKTESDGVAAEKPNRGVVRVFDWPKKEAPNVDFYLLLEADYTGASVETSSEDELLFKVFLLLLKIPRLTVQRDYTGTEFVSFGFPKRVFPFYGLLKMLLIGDGVFPWFDDNWLKGNCDMFYSWFNLDYCLVSGGSFWVVFYFKALAKGVLLI